MPLIGLDHIQIAMPKGGEDAARGFYGSLLGMEEVPKPEPGASRGGCWFSAGFIQVHMGVEADFRPAKKAHPAFLVDDLPALVAKLEAAGYAPVADHELASHKRVFVADPFGNKVELMEKKG